MELDLNDVVVFNEVVASGSFTAAGKKLALPPSAVSRRIARLEDRLGFKLLHRTTRSIGLTDSGRVYHEHTAQIGEQLEQAARAVNDKQRHPTGLVRVTAPPDDGGLIWRLLVGFLRDNPRVDIEIIHTLEYLDLIDEGIDIALRGGSPPDSTVFTAHQLFDSRLLLAASPAYLESRGMPEQVKDLEDHDCIGMDTWAPNAIRSLDGARGPVRLTLRNRVRVNRLETAQQAALAGFGVAPLLEMICQRELQSGELVEVLRGALPMESGFFAVYPAGRKMSAAASALLDHILATAPSVASA
jgi:DNA-binding transcriptional LysR family regulator